jgi:DNA-binding HxlR family transcriptional regulator
MGKTLDGPISKLWDWSAEHHTAILEARAIYDARADAVAAAEPRKVAYVNG